MKGEALSQLVGKVVDGKYQVEGLLGHGGMGAVFRAIHLGTDRVVALKVIAPSLAAEPEYLARFSREARACGRLRHPGIVDVTDFGIASHENRPLAYLVMEFLDGCTLADVLREEERPPLAWVIEILEQVCSCVEEAHRQGILHRDLKPENIWLEPNRRGGFSVKILDFGLAKLDTPARPDRHTPSGYGAGKAERAPRDLESDMATYVSPSRDQVAPGLDIEQTMDSSASRPASVPPGSSELDASAMSSVAGTPAYMSPEQTRGETVTARADVYSLGVLAYRMIGGRLPFEGSITEVLAAQLEREPQPLRELRPDVHEDAARLVASAMSKDPAARPASAGVFGNMLAAQLESAATFFRRAFLLCVDRAGTFLRLGLLATAPMLILSTLLAVWQLAHFTLGVPSLGGTASIVALGILFLLSMVAQTALGAMPIFVLHAVAAPLRPLDERALVRAYAPRLRRWARTMAPMMLAMVAWLAFLVAFVWLIGFLAPWVRQFSRPVRIAMLVPLVLVPFVAGFLALKRKGLRLRQTGFLGAILLIEDLHFDSATARSAELMINSGSIRNSVQKWYLVVIGMTSGLLGAYIGATGLRTETAVTLLPMMPILSLVFMLLLTLNAVVGSLIYLSARRATGESLERIFEDFEESALPPDRANLADHTRLRERLPRRRSAATPVVTESGGTEGRQRV